MADYNPFGFRNYGRVTASAGTAYTQLVEPMGNPSCATLLNFAQVTVSTTAQTLIAMRPVSALTIPNTSVRASCYLTAAAAGGQAVINVNQNPGTFTVYSYPNGGVPRTANRTVSSGDYVAYQYPDGTWEVNTISSISTLAFTLTNNLSTGNSSFGLAANAPVWYFGPTTQVNPYDGLAHPVFTLPASGVINFGSEAFPLMSTLGLNEPLLLYCANATAASTLERVSASYAAKNGPYASYA
jgi:hypothetical protein